jgi:hypothetical protein
MSVVEATEGLLVGLDARAETDPAREERRQRRYHALVLTTIVAVQLLWLSSFGYAAYVFLLS